MFARRLLADSQRAVPRTAALVVALVAIVNVVSALTPNASWRGHLLLQVEPIDAMHVFHALTAAVFAARVAVLARRGAALRP